MGSSLRIPGSSVDDISRWVLLGMEQDRQAILAHIAEITAKLDGPGGSSRRQHKPHREHRISAEGRAAIAAAQTKRWARTRRETKKKQQRAAAPRWVGKSRLAGPKPRRKAASPSPPPPIESPEVN
jgi:hypothetical protein